MLADLMSVGGLFPLLNYLKNSNARIRAKAAQVLTTVVQNNPISQQSVMEASGFEPLFLNFMFDPDLTARIKALGAISCECFSEMLFINYFFLLTYVSVGPEHKTKSKIFDENSIVWSNLLV